MLHWLVIPRSQSSWAPGIGLVPMAGLWKVFLLVVAMPFATSKLVSSLAWSY